LRPIQYLLLGLLGAGLVYYFARLRSRLTDRLLLCALGLLGAVSVVFPDLTTALAHLLGVGRGVDLVIYIMLLTFSYGWLLLYAKVRALQMRLTDLARAIALANARVPAPVVHEFPPVATDRPFESTAA
jgi:small membrane protein